MLLDELVDVEELQAAKVKAARGVVATKAYFFMGIPHFLVQFVSSFED